jgi:hypothetical protein
MGPRSLLTLDTACFGTKVSLVREAFQVNILGTLAALDHIIVLMIPIITFWACMVTELLVLCIISMVFGTIFVTEGYGVMANVLCNHTSISILMFVG